MALGVTLYVQGGAFPAYEEVCGTWESLFEVCGTWKPLLCPREFV